MVAKFLDLSKPWSCKYGRKNEKIETCDFPMHECPLFSSILRRCKMPFLSRKIVEIQNVATMVTNATLGLSITTLHMFLSCYKCKSCFSPEKKKTISEVCTRKARLHTTANWSLSSVGIKKDDIKFMIFFFNERTGGIVETTLETILLGSKCHFSVNDDWLWTQSCYKV